MTHNEIEKIKNHFKPPFKYHREIPSIWDSNNQHVIDIRGWGYLSGKMNGSDACIIQDLVGEMVCDLMNGELKP